MSADEKLNEQEVEQRREAALKRMLNTPHKPHAPLKKKRKAEAKPSRVSRTKLDKP